MSTPSAGGAPSAPTAAGSPNDVLSVVLGHGESSPSRVAIRDLRRELSYGELTEELRQVSAGLASLGVSDGSRVALLIGNSVDFVVAALACSWVGAIFVPVSVSDPEARQAAIISDCDPDLVITSTEEGYVPGWRHAVPFCELAQLAGTPSAPLAGGNRVAYAIYTSGTTGSPKGVMISRSAFATSVAEIARTQPVTSETRALCVSPVHFDGSFSLIFPTLYCGGFLAIPDRDSLTFPRAYFAALKRHEINAVSFSPSFLRLLMAGRGLAAFADSEVEIVAMGGEAPSCNEVRALWDAKPSIRIINRYGPTETTISVSDLELTPEILSKGYVPIGGPHRGSTFHLLSATGEAVEAPGEAGEAGELYVGGDQLMEGYWNAAELTESVLRSDLVPGETVYKTGDIVRLDEFGRYFFLGRADRVVKRSGVRVSLVEVADKLSQLDGVRATATATFDNEGALGVAAFVVADPGIDHLHVRDRAAALLPPAMIPDHIIVTAELPLTSSSKVDEQRLLALAGLIPWSVPPT